MNRWILAPASLVILLSSMLPVVAAADLTGGEHAGRVLMVVNGDVDLPADAHADVVVAIQSPVTLGPGTTVNGDVLTLESLVTKIQDARVAGEVRNLGWEAGRLALRLAPILLLWLLGVVLAGIAFALLVVAIGTRQVRAATSLMSGETLLTAMVGLAGTILPVVIAIPLVVSVVGAPLALGLLLGLWPIAAALGWIVVAVWIGERIVGGLSPEVRREKPYLAAIIGAVVLDVMAIFPPAVMLATMFGYGAVLLLAWRTVRGTSARFAGPGVHAVPGAPSVPPPIAG